MVLFNPLLVKANEVLGIDGGHEVPAQIKGLIDGSVFITGLT
jgi:hypothetical protein